MENVFAQVDIQGLSPTFGQYRSFGQLVNVIVRNATMLAGVICLVILVVGGFRFIMSPGDSKQAEGGKKAITAAITGLVLIFLSFWIVQIIQKITGVNIVTPPQSYN